MPTGKPAPYARAAAEGEVEPAPATAPDALASRLVGPHLPARKGLSQTVARAAEIGATALQIFADNPMAWRRRSEPPPDVAVFRERLAAMGIGALAIHGPYLINLAGGDEVVWQRSVEALAHELRVGAAYGAVAVNIHIGSHRGGGREHGYGRLVEGLRRVLADVPAAGSPLLVLENGAGAGDTMGTSVEDLAEILDRAESAGVDADRLAFCLDTAHLWAAGIPIADEDGVDGLVRRIHQLLGPGKVGMLHLNDARTGLGSRLDRHEHIGAGAVGAAGLRAVLCHPALARLPTFLETPAMEEGYDAVNLERVRLMLQGAPLPELPREAFTVRSGRKRRSGRPGAELGGGREPPENAT